jgi:hypothetical protein
MSAHDVEVNVRRTPLIGNGNTESARPFLSTYVCLS